jgi:hypothetical protein
MFAGEKLGAAVESSLSNVRSALDGAAGVVGGERGVAGRHGCEPPFARASGAPASGSARSAQAPSENTRPITPLDTTSHVMDRCVHCSSFLSHCSLEAEH